MFPLKDNIPARLFPAVNIWLIMVNVLCFVYELRLGNDLDALIFEYGFVPARFTMSPVGNLAELGRLLIPVFTSMFLHGGFFHLLSNMWMLWIFGDNVEDSMGHWRYLIFYLSCGVFSVLVQGFSSPDSVLPTIGASGAIAGVLGAYFFLYPRAKILTLIPIFILFYLVELPAFLFLGLWIGLQLVRGWGSILGGAAGGGVAWWAHIGGFAAGLLLISFFRVKGLVKGKNRRKLVG